MSRAVDDYVGIRERMKELRGNATRAERKTSRPTEHPASQYAGCWLGRVHSRWTDNFNDGFARAARASEAITADASRGAIANFDIVPEVPRVSGGLQRIGPGQPLVRVLAVDVLEPAAVFIGDDLDNDRDLGGHHLALRLLLRGAVVVAAR